MFYIKRMVSVEIMQNMMTGCEITSCS